MATSNSVLTDDRWHYAVCTISGTTLSLYIDGILQSQATITGTQGAPTGELNIGSNPPWTGGGRQYEYYGSVDEVRISNIARSADEIQETYRQGRDHYLNRTLSSTNLSAKTSLPFYVAADRPGSYLSVVAGESAYANLQPDTNTAAFWHLDESDYDNDSVLKIASTNVAAANAYSYWKTISGQATVVATNDTIEYDVYLGTNLTNIGVIDGRFTDTTVIRSFVNCHNGDHTAAYLNWKHVVCTLPAGVNGKTLDWIDLVNENDTSTASVVYYDNFVIKNSAGAIKATLYTGGTTAFNVLNFESNAGNLQTLTYSTIATEAISHNEGRLLGSAHKDSSGNLNTLSPAGGYSAEGALGRAYTFNGFNYLSAPDSANLDITSAITLEAWIYPTSVTGYRTIVGKRDISLAEFNYALRTNGDEIEFYFTGSAATQIAATTNSNISLNKWQHVAVTHNSTNVYFYLNGTLQASSCISGTCNMAMTVDNNSVSVGRPGDYDNQYFVGLIDEVRISNVARTQDQINQTFEIGGRTHPITIDFAAKLDATNLITVPEIWGFSTPPTSAFQVKAVPSIPEIKS